MFFIRFFCLVCIIAIIITVSINPYLSIIEIFFAALLIYVHHIILIHKTEKLRTIKFKSIKYVDIKVLFKELEPVLKETYNIHVNVEKHINVLILYEGLVFNVVFNDDETFCIKWLPLSLKSISDINKYKHYKTIVSGMRIIAYEIQKYFGLN